jgi:NAD-dependent dihydropyrimidine dehydrogenase PreA subunit
LKYITEMYMSSSAAPTRKRKRLLVPREEIAWFPTIDVTVCNGCGDCVAFCRPGVFEFSQPAPGSPEAQRPRMQVANPYDCMVLCTRCQPICTSGAISLPRTADFEHFVEYLD